MKVSLHSIFKMGLAESILESVFMDEERNEHVRDTETQLKKTRMEVSELRPIITKNVVEEIYSQENSMVVRYSDLQDISEISKHIKTIFKDEQALEFLTSAAAKMVAAFQSSKEMTELLRWNQVKKVCEKYK